MASGLGGWFGETGCGLDAAIAAFEEANARMRLGDYPRAITAFERSLEHLTEDGAPGGPRLAASILAGIAECGVSSDHFEEVDVLYQVAVELSRQDGDVAGAVRHTIAWAEAMRWAGRLEDTKALERTAIQTLLGMASGYSPSEGGH